MWPCTGSSGTALNGAAYWNTPDIVDLLLDTGADATHVDSYGRAAWQYAMVNPLIRSTPMFARLREAVQRGD